jgi:hypothetical protein
MGKYDLKWAGLAEGGFEVRLVRRQEVRRCLSITLELRV